jgi:hypothetical protein
MLLCAHVGNPLTFVNLKDKWIPEVLRHCPGIPFLVVGIRNETAVGECQYDNTEINPLSETEYGRRLALQTRAFGYLECDIYNNIGVKEVFDEASNLASPMAKNAKKTTSRRSNLFPGDRMRIGRQASSGTEATKGQTQFNFKLIGVRVLLPEKKTEACRSAPSRNIITPSFSAQGLASCMKLSN